MEDNPSAPKVDTGAASAQIDQLTNAAEHANERLRAAEEHFKKTKDDVLGLFGASISSAQARTLVMMLDTCFTYGQVHGESSETVMQSREQSAMLARMIREIEETTKVSKERDARHEKREDEIRVRDEKMLRLTERQVAALEALIGAKPKAAPKTALKKRR